MNESKLKNQEKVFRNKLDKFKKTLAQFRKETKTGKIKKAEKKMNLKLNSELVDFYNKYKSYSVSWEGVFQDYQIVGQVSIRPITILDSLNFGGDNELDLGAIRSDTIDKEHLYIFDRIDNLGNYVLIHLEDEQAQLYLFTYGMYFNQINLSVSAYIEKSIAYLGMSLWQLFYVEKPSAISSYFLWDDGCFKVLKEVLREEEYNHSLKKIKDFPTKNKVSSNHNFKENLNTHLKNFKKAHKIKINTFKQALNANVNILMKAQESLGVSFPQTVIELYSQTNGLELEWEKGELGGSINFLPLEEMFGGERWYVQHDWNDSLIFKDVLWFGEENEEDLNVIEQLKPLEMFNGSSDFVGFLVNDAGEFELYYSYGRTDIIKLPIGLDKYITLSIRLLGIYGWQEYYLKDSDKIQEDTGLLDKIQQVFPDFKEEEFF